MKPPEKKKENSEEKIKEAKRAINVLKDYVLKEKKIIKEMVSVLKELKEVNEPEERKMVLSHISSLKAEMNKIGSIISEILTGEKAIVKPFPIKIKKETIPEEIPLNIPTPKKIIKKPVHEEKSSRIKKILPKLKIKEKAIGNLEKESVRRFKKEGRKIVYFKKKSPSVYVKTASNLFSKTSLSLVDKDIFKPLEKNLIKANLKFVPANYISVMLMTTLISAVFGILLFIFLLFFEVSSINPIISISTEDVITRGLKFFWIIFAVPLGIFGLMYVYPSMEKKSIESKIENELPFATIHMSAISGSMINPSEIFKILISTKEYPYLEKEFIKLMNEINVYGYDLTSALRNIAEHSPSKKLTELFNGLAVTINSGGNLPEFFDKRAESLLFDYKIEREKYNKSAETFMDIYISVVIAAPMILMLLLMMMKISGLGISLSTDAITLIMVSSVTVINLVFIMFLHFKQPK